MSACPKIGWLSPALVVVPDGQVAAYEMKFQTSSAVADAVESWIAERLPRDPHADPAFQNSYLVTSIYLDTPEYDVLRRTERVGPHKHRIRRYGNDAAVHLERKSKTRERVWKTRATLPLERLQNGLPIGGGSPSWFTQEVEDLSLQPVCRISYRRSAFVGTGSHGPLRVTLDRAACGEPASDFLPRPVVAGIDLLGDGVILECKFLVTLPPLFKLMIEEFQLLTTGASKYRRCARSLGVVNGEQLDA